MSTLSLLACALTLQVPIDEPPRLRTVLDNGVALLVERSPGSSAVTVDLWISSASMPETSIRNGVRHLLEHILARGPKGDIDQRLESAGGFLTANTYRDAMRFEVTLPREKLLLGIQVLRDALTLSEVTKEQIDHESKIVQLESKIREPAAVLSAAAWDAAYDGQAPDPAGNPDVVAGTTPATLANVHRAMARGNGLAVVIVGDVDLDASTKLAKEAFGYLAKGEPVSRSRKKGHGGGARSDTDGVARAAVVEGFRQPATAAALMAGLALASEADGSFFSYTPSDEPGLMIVGQSRGSDIGAVVDQADPKTLYSVGRTLAKRWVRSYLSSQAGIAYLRGLLLCQGQALRPETMMTNIDIVTVDAFADSVESYRDMRCVKVAGK